MPRKSVDSILANYLQLLGKVPDQEIANKAGVSRAVTVSYRKKLGIAPYSGHRHRESAPETVAPPVAAEPPVAARRGRKPKAAAVVETTNKKPAKVEEAPPAAPETSNSFRGRKSALDSWVHLLGKIPDADVAKQANVTPENVRTYRNRRGIPAVWRSSEPEAAPAAVAPPAPAPVAAPVEAPKAVVVTNGVANHAWAVAIDDGTTMNAVVLAPNMVAAAQATLAKMKGGVVRSISWIGELL